MSSSKSIVDYIIDQTSGAGSVRARAMFGEYGIYCDDKMVALVCDDRLFIKPTDEGLAFAGPLEQGYPYPGARLYPMVREDKWDDAAFMAELFARTARALPAPKPKRPRKTSS